MLTKPLLLLAVTRGACYRLINKTSLFELTGTGGCYRQTNLSVGRLHLQKGVTSNPLFETCKIVIKNHRRKLIVIKGEVGRGWILSFNPSLTTDGHRQESFWKEKPWDWLIIPLVDSASQTRGKNSWWCSIILGITNYFHLTAGAVSWPDIFSSFLLFMLFSILPWWYYMTKATDLMILLPCQNN